MKKLFLICVFGFSAHSLFAQINDVKKIFDKYQDVDGITSIKVTKPMFNLLSKLDIQDESLKKIRPLLATVNSLSVLISEEPLNDSILNLKPGLKYQANKNKMLQEQINSAVKGLKYEELVTINSNGRKIKLLTISPAGNVLKNLLLSFTGNGKNILMLLDGEIPMSEVSKLMPGDQ